MTQVERFWSKVRKGKAHDACWLWLGSRNHAGKGYGTFGGMGAHKFSFVIHYACEPLPGVCVLHRCDNPGCVNPEHLFLGTQKENVDDMIAKGRKAVGERTNTAKLTPAAVEFISAQKGIQPPQDLALTFRVAQRTIYRIWAGATWRGLRRQSA